MSLGLSDAYVESLITVSDIGCWIWCGPISKKGFPYLAHNGKTNSAQKLVRSVFGKQLRDSERLLSLCKNNLCVSPHHNLYTDEKVLAKLLENKETGCLEYQGKLIRGYGSAFIEGKTQYVHRWLLKKHLGSIPEGMFALHKCNNPKCCRIHPDHVYAGTHKQNMVDMVESNRQCQGDAHWARSCPEKLTFGEDHWTAKKPELIRHGEQIYNTNLTDQQVLEIREEVAKNKLSYKQIGEKFGLDWSTVQNISSGKSWSHLGGPITVRGKGSKPEGYEYKRGSESPNSKLTESDVLEIRRLWVVEAMTHPKIASIFGLNQSTVSDICRFKSWRHVGGEKISEEEVERRRKLINKKFSDAQMQEIRSVALTGTLSRKEICQRFNASSSTVSRILTSKSI